MLTEGAPYKWTYLLTYLFILVIPFISPQLERVKTISTNHRGCTG